MNILMFDVINFKPLSSGFVEDRVYRNGANEKAKFHITMSENNNIHKITFIFRRRPYRIDTLDEVYVCVFWVYIIPPTSYNAYLRARSLQQMSQSSPANLNETKIKLKKKLVPRNCEKVRCHF